MNPWAYVLLASLALNALLGWDDLRLREKVGAVAVERDTARGAATACSDATEALADLATKQKDAGAQLLKDAKAKALTLEQRANAERSRSQAVPGNACASAAQETAEWLTKRRGAP